MLRKTLALLAWVIIYIPTSIFVILVLVKSYLEHRRAKKTGDEGVVWA